MKLLIIHLIISLSIYSCIGKDQKTTLDFQDSSVSSGVIVGSVFEFNKDVLPILNKRCVKCHRSGGVASWLKLDSYDQAKAMGTSIKRSVENRTMPPFKAIDDGSCNKKTFKDSNWLDQSEVTIIKSWVDGGMIEGEAQPPLPSYDNTNLIEVEATTSYVTFDIATQEVTENPNFSYLPKPENGRTDEYRCFIVKVQGINKGDIISGFKFLSPDSNGSATDLSNKTNHHMVLFDPIDVDALKSAFLLDSSDGVNGDGYTCYGDSKVSAKIAGIWAPGGDVTYFPGDGGIKKNIDQYYIMQMHFFTGHGNAATAPMIEFDLNPTAQNILEYVSFPNTNIAFQGQNGIVDRSEEMLLKSIVQKGITDTTTIKMWGAFLHQHSLGYSIKLSSLENGCLVDIPRWDFDWQRSYLWESPVIMTGAESLKVTCQFDSNLVEAGVTVNWGDNSNDEMCWAFMLMSQ